MFTGLIQAPGTIQSIASDQLQISCEMKVMTTVLSDLEIGDSVAVDGVCLTVTQILSSGFVAAASPETLNRTNLGDIEGNATVNLETSLRVGSKLGGHFVTGHVDGLGYLEATRQTANAWEMSFIVKDPRIARYIVPKGSIAVNGVSLTVADCNPEGTWFKAAVIPLTYAETNLRYLKPSSRVNLEGDVLGKYVEKFLRLNLNGQVAQGDLEAIAALDYTLAATRTDDINPTFLAEHGYL